MDITDHGTNVTGRVLVLLKPINVRLESGVPVEVVGLVDGVDLATLGYLDVGVSQDELTNLGVQGEAIDTITEGQDQDSGGGVHAIAGSHQTTAGLEGVHEARHLLLSDISLIINKALLLLNEDTKDGASGDGGIDVG